MKSERESISRSVVSDSLQPHGLQPARLPCPWGSPGQDTGVGCHSLLQGIFLTQGWNPASLHCRQTLYRLSHLMVGGGGLCPHTRLPEPAPHSFLPSCHPGDSSLRPSVSPRRRGCQARLQACGKRPAHLWTVQASVAKARPQGMQWPQTGGLYTSQVSKGLQLLGPSGRSGTLGQRKALQLLLNPEWGQQNGSMGSPFPRWPSP